MGESFTPRLNHVAISVDPTLLDVHARTTHGDTHDYVLTSAYIGFVIPLMIELQHIERQERA